MAILLLGAMAVLLLSRVDPPSPGSYGATGRNLSWLGAGTVVVAAGLGCIPAVQVLLGGSVLQFRFPWPVPYGEFFIELDPLSAWFLLPTFLLSALSAIYGVGYLRPWLGRRSLGPVWFFYGLLVLGMMLVLLARNAVLFLFAWELMAVASFFLVTFEHERPSVREAGWIYLVATHLGTAFLLAFFLLLGRETGSMDFDVWAAQGIHTQGLASVLFLLAVVGFGTKAGFMPLHVWLPEAHPAAPSHVSALMSGVMIKTGIYGLLRAFTFLGTPPLWWGWLLIAIGLTSGVLGMLFALAQHDLKRMLAYSSVENIGIIALGLGVGLLGMSTASPLLMVLGFGGALLHVLNHALFKGLLFLGAGAVVQRTGTHEIDQLGGLLKRMPWTAAAFLVGAVAISGLAAIERFRERVSDFFRRVQGRHVNRGRNRRALAGVDCGAGAHWRAGGGMFHPGIRHCFSRPTAQRTRRARTRSGPDHAVAHAGPGGRLRAGGIACAGRGRMFAGGFADRDGAATGRGRGKSGRGHQPADVCGDWGRCLSGADARADYFASRSAGRPARGSRDDLGLRVCASRRRGSNTPPHLLRSR